MPTDAALNNNSTRRTAMGWTGLLLCGAMLAPAARAQKAFDYRLGNTAVTEDMRRMVIHAQPPQTVEMLPGGKPWPLVALDEAGRLYVGGSVVDTASGRLLRSAPGVSLPYGVQLAVAPDGYRITRAGGRACVLSLKQLGLSGGKNALQALQDANIAFAAAPRRVLALSTQFGADGNVAGYTVAGIDTAACKVAHSARLGNPDLLVELNRSSAGGWWITGSSEQTLLRSSDGRRWRKVELPAALSSLVSSYVVNDKEIWLAAALGGDTGEHPYMLVYSGDGGSSWASLRKDDPLLGKLPPAWLEGQRRKVPAPDG